MLLNFHAGGRVETAALQMVRDLDGAANQPA
jgi:hypothetical protein